MAGGPVEFRIEEIRALTENFGHYLAEGKYGMVFRGRVTEHNPRNIPAQDVVVKMSKDGAANSEMWKQERNFLEGCDHPNVMKLIGFADDEDDNKYYLVFPFYPNGTLQDMITGLDWPQTLKILEGIASGLHGIHTCRYPTMVHADLKPDNILLDQEYNAVICDFGTIAEEGAPHRHGTLGYMDPSTMGGIHQETDIYSLGVIILQMITQREHTHDEDGHITTIAENAFKARRQIVHQNLKASGCNKKVGKKITELALQCTDREIEKRPTTADDVVEALGNLGARESFFGRVFNVMKCKTT